jgi:hypothetical protein
MMIQFLFDFPSINTVVFMEDIMWPFKKEKFAIVAQMCEPDGSVGWKVLINDRKSFYANFGTVPPGIPYNIEDWTDNKRIHKDAQKDAHL